MVNILIWQVILSFMLNLSQVINILIVLEYSQVRKIDLICLNLKSNAVCKQMKNRQRKKNCWESLFESNKLYNCKQNEPVCLGLSDYFTFTGIIYFESCYTWFGTDLILVKFYLYFIIWVFISKKQTIQKENWIRTHQYLWYWNKWLFK